MQPNIEYEAKTLNDSSFSLLTSKNNSKMTYPSSSLRPISGEMSSINTVRQHISRHPLTSVTSSLCCNTCHFHWHSHVNLQPLMMVIHPRWPCSHSSSCSLLVQPGQACTMVYVPLGWGTDLVAAYAAVFHSHWSVALWAYNFQVVSN